MKPLRLLGILLLALTCPLPGVAADVPAPLRPEQMLVELSFAIGSGDNAAVLKHFTDNPDTRKKWESMTPDMKKAFSRALRTAILLRADDSKRVYSLRMFTSTQIITMNMGLTQTDVGEWLVDYW